MADSNLNGVFVVVPTPLHEDERIDESGLRHLVDYYIRSGCHGLVTLGSGGEFPYFSFEERLTIARIAADAASGRVPVLLGVGFCGAVEAEAFIRNANSMGADGYLVAVPTYYAVGFDDLLSYLDRVSRASDRPVLYYHFPPMTQLHLNVDQIGQILALPGLIGMKESTLSIPEIKRHLKLCRKADTSIFAGNAVRLLDVLEHGGAGVIGVLPSIAPRLIKDCYNLWAAGDREKAKACQRDIVRLLPFLISFSLPLVVQRTAFGIISSLWFSFKARVPSRQAVFKETLRQLGHPITARARSPLPQVQSSDCDAIAEMIAKHKSVLESV
jgi:4-hydroxy-tetrahydrodipicolinate synthase